MTVQATSDVSAAGVSNLKASLSLVGLNPVMRHSAGHTQVLVGLVDGPVKATHPSLVGARIVELHSPAPAVCATTGDQVCLHGTFVAGLLVASQGTSTPGICPGCTLLVRSVPFQAYEPAKPPTTTPRVLAEAIVACIDAGAWVVNLSIGLARPTPNRDTDLDDALTYAARRGALVVAAAGNRSTVGGSVITRHPAVLPVTSCDSMGIPLAQAALGRSIALHGVLAPGRDIEGIAPDGGVGRLTGASVAAPFVTGTAALLWSMFPKAPAVAIKGAITRPWRRRTSIIPPVLDAAAAHAILLNRKIQEVSER